MEDTLLKYSEWESAMFKTFLLPTNRHLLNNLINNNILFFYEKKIKDHRTTFFFFFIFFTLSFLASAVLFGFNAKNFHRKGNNQVTPAQKKGSQKATLFLLLTAISLIGFILTLIIYFHSKK